MILMLLLLCHIAIVPSTCFDLPTNECDDEYVMTSSCDAMLHRISCENSICHIKFVIT